MSRTYDPKITALLCIDFYNDFLSEAASFGPGQGHGEGGQSARQPAPIVRTAREAGIKVYHVPHHRGDRAIT